MPFFQVKIKPAKWYRHDGVPWLNEGDVQADALWDLRVSSNLMSAWQIADDKSNLNQVIAALTATRNTLCEFGYALLQQQVVLELGIKFEQTSGTSRDQYANAQWHYNFVQLTASQICALTNEIKKKENRFRAGEWEVKVFLEEGVRLGRIRLEDLDPSIQKKLKLLPHTKT